MQLFLSAIKPRPRRSPHHGKSTACGSVHRWVHDIVTSPAMDYASLTATALNTVAMALEHNNQTKGYERMHALYV